MQPLPHSPLPPLPPCLVPFLITWQCRSAPVDRSVTPQWPDASCDLLVDYECPATMVVAGAWREGERKRERERERERGRERERERERVREREREGE